MESKRGVPKATHAPIDAWEADLHSRRSKTAAKPSWMSSAAQEDADSAKNNRCGRLVSRPAFHFAVGFAIVLNAIIIGVETDEKDPDSTALDKWYIVEVVFSLLFLMEIIIKCIAFGAGRFLANVWNLFDAVIVLVSVADVLVLQPTFDDDFAQDVGIVTLLRVIRLVRLGRLLRFIRFFEHLHILVRGLRKAVKPLFWVTLLLFMAMYIFAVFATRLIGHSEVWRDGQGDNDDLVQDYFGTVSLSLYTLFQVMTLESWSNGIARVIMEEQPAIWVFFVIWILLATFTFINVITGIVVEKLMAAADDASKLREHEALVKRLEEEAAVLRMFRTMDANNDGRLSIDEIHDALRDPKKALHATLAKFLPPDTRLSIEDLTAMFDSNGDGYIEYEEFVKSVFRLGDNILRRDVVVLNAKVSTSFQQVRREIDAVHRSIRMAMARQTPNGEGAMSWSQEPPRSPVAREEPTSPSARSATPSKIMKGRGNSGMVRGAGNVVTPPPPPASASRSARHTSSSSKKKDKKRSKSRDGKKKERRHRH